MATTSKLKEITNQIADSDEITYIPPHLKALIEEVDYYYNSLLNELNRIPTFEEIAIKMNNKVSIEKIKELYEISLKISKK